MMMVISFTDLSTRAVLAHALAFGFPQNEGPPGRLSARL